MRIYLNKNIYIVLLSILSAINLFGTIAAKQSYTPRLKGLAQYVDPYIGTGDHGHVFVGANVPYGAVQLGPTQYSQGWDWCSGYHISDSIIIGFSHTHLSGTGIGDLGDISFMPAIGEIKLTRGNLRDEKSGIYSKYSHKNEIVKAGFYSVHLDRFNIDVALTATKRVGFHQYTFPESKNAKIIIDLEHGIGWDTPTETYLVQENDSVVSGYRFTRGWAKDQRIYFSATFSKPMKKFIVSDTTSIKSGNTIKVAKAYGQAIFETNNKEKIYVKVSISPVSIENAKLNMKIELSSWNFDQAVTNASNNWNEALNKIAIVTDNKNLMHSFYTALYHTMIAPSLYCDVNGDYRGTDGKIYRNVSFTNYTTFSLWDTYRAAQPLMTLISPEMIPDIANTFLKINNEQGKLPIWHLMGNETDCMVGNPGTIALADIVLKGYKVDNEAAFQAMKKSQLLDEYGLKYMKQYGYIPCDKQDESVSRALEYAIADWSTAQIAKKLNKTDDYNYFIKRSKAYTYYFDPETKFMRPKLLNGKFKTPFDPLRTQDEKGVKDFTEGNAWQYTWLVPHDINGLVSCFGSRESFIQKLDSLFIVKEKLGTEAPPDISGLIGQYAQGNEPSHHILYMYAYVGQQWKTAEKVREVLHKFYSSRPAGLSGNEDVGQMSAWFVLSAMGIYQVVPAGGVYVFGSPLVNEATLKVKDGKTFKIIAHLNSKKNIYIQRATLNGKNYTKSYINFTDIMAGGVLKFEMGSTPSHTFGMNKADRP